MRESIPQEARLSRYAIDGMLPDRVLRPESESELSGMLSELHHAKECAIPWSGGTRISIGNVPEAYDAALDLNGIKSHMEHVPGDMTVICDAGTPVAEINRELLAHNQRLPFMTPDSRHATIGGSVAANAPSLLRPCFGSIREWIIGMRIVLGDGIAIKSGGRVVKNVQGYDMHRLQVGAYGTLGIITQVALKLVPIPKSVRTVALWFNQTDVADHASADIMASNLDVQAARMYTGSRVTGIVRELSSTRYMDAVEDADVLILVQIAGSGAAIERQTDELIGLSGTVPAAGCEVLEAASEAQIWSYLDGSMQGSTRIFGAQIAVKPSDAINVLKRWQRFASRTSSGADFNAMIDIGYGSVTLSVDNAGVEVASDAVAQCLQIVREFKGSALIEACPTDVKREIDVFMIDQNLESLMKRMKHQFDPHRVLNRGRYAFRI